MIPGIGIGVGYYPESYGAGGWTPYVVPNLATRYDLSQTSSYITSTGVKLLGDLSGNSNVNVLALNTVVGNYASSPDANALDITGDIDLRFQATLVSWASGSEQYLISKWTSGNSSNSYSLAIATNGAIKLYASFAGTDFGSVGSTSITGFAAFSTNWVRATRVVSTGVTTFYTSSDGTNWTQLGNTSVFSAGSTIFAGTAPLALGTLFASQATTAMNIYRAQIYNGINGTLAFDANFATASKLATSFTESSTNAATVTINTSGDLGARICGARDLVQLTGAKQPTLSGGGIRFTAASSQYLRSALWSCPQPFTRFSVLRQVAWGSGLYLLDGAASANTAGVVQTTSTPQINLNSGSSVAANTDLTVGTTFVLVQTVNGASSSLQVNSNAATTGNAGAGVPNGFTFGANGAATPASFSDMLLLGDLTYTAALDSQTKAQIVAWLRQYYAV